MQRSFAESNLLLGIIEELDIHKIKQPHFVYYRDERNSNIELVNSIRQNGLLHPIVVRTRGSFFEIIAGCRRYNACKSLGLRKIICHIVELDDKSAFEVSLTENIQRKVSIQLKKQRAFKAYVDDFGWGGLTELALKISKSPAYVCKRLSLLKLPNELLERVRIHELSPSVAEELIPLKNIHTQETLANTVLEQHCSSRETRRLVETSKKSLNNLSETQLGIDTSYYHDNILDIEVKAQRSFDKTITTLKIAINKISGIVEGVEDNWIVYEILMQHKNMLNAQIDVLIREKKKLDDCMMF